MENDLVNDFDKIESQRAFFHFLKLQFDLSQEIKKNSSVTLTLLENTFPKETSVKVKTFPFSKIKESYLLFLAALFTLIIAFILNRKKSQDSAVFVLTLLLSSASIIFVSYGIFSLRSLTLNTGVLFFLFTSNYIAFMFFPILFLHFFLLFPLKYQFILNKKIVRTLYLLPVVLTPIYLLRVVYEVQQLLYLFGIIGGILTMFVSYFRATTLQKSQLKWILWGTSLFSTIMLASYVLPMLGIFPYLYSNEIPAIAFTIIPISIVISILKYKLMKIDSLIDSTLLYLSTFLLLFFIDFVIVSITNEFFTDINYKAFVGIWMVIVLYAPIRSILSNFIKRIFKRETYQTEILALEFAKKIMSIENQSVLFDMAFTFLRETLHPKMLHRVAKEAIGIEITDITYLYTINSNLYLPQEYDAGLIVPLSYKNEHNGYLLLANKENETLYSKQDLNFIRIIISQTLSAFEMIKEKELAKEDREKMTQEIHDGIGGISTNINMISCMAKENAQPEETTKSLTSIATLSKDLIFEVRTILTSIDISNSTYEEFSQTLLYNAKTMLEMHQISLDFKTHIEENMKAPAAVISLNILRIYNEFLTNSIKYSNAKHLYVKLDVTKNELKLYLEDDGIGFIANSRGRGLIHMRKRAESINAFFELNGENGARLAVKVNL